MKHGLKTAFIAGVALIGSGLVDAASAMPAAALPQVIAGASDGTPSIENIYYYRYYRYHYYRPYRYYHYRHYRRHFFHY